MLPIIDQPTFSAILPTTGKKIRFRPYLVKEEKVLLMAAESTDPEDHWEAIKQVVNNCLIDKVNIEDLPTIDVESFFLQLRAKSVGEILTPNYRCENVVDGKKCGNLMKMKMDLSDIKPTTIKSPKELKIFFTKTMGVQLRYPSYTNFLIKNVENDIEYMSLIMASCIEYIFDGEDIYYTKDYSKEDVVKFIEALSKPQYAQLEKFFEELPVLRHELNHKCEKCGFDHHILLEGYEAFFA